MSRVTFKQWMRKQVDRADPIGDVARDELADGCSRGSTFEAIRAHAVDIHGAGDQVQSILDDMNREYLATFEAAKSRHQWMIDTASAYTTALGEQWLNLTRGDRQEAERVLADYVSNLHTLGVRVEVTPR